MLIYPGISRTTRSSNKKVNLSATTTQMNGILIRAWKGKLAHNGTRESLMAMACCLISCSNCSSSLCRRRQRRLCQFIMVSPPTRVPWADPVLRCFSNSFSLALCILSVYIYAVPLAPCNSDRSLICRCGHSMKSQPTFHYGFTEFLC